MGRCGKSTKQAALTSYEEYLYLVEGKREEATQNWEMTRWLGWYVEQLSPYIKEGHKHKKPEDVFRLAGEKQTPKEKKTTGKIPDEVIAELNTIFKDYINNRNKN